MLAPYFGNSLYVWGALIGVVLAGPLDRLLARRRRSPTAAEPRLLVGLLGVGALLVLAIPFVDGWVLDRVVDWDPGPRLNPLIATILLFGCPSVVLGTVSPVAVRLKARSLEHLGRTAGRLFAVSTAGSIAGTFLTVVLADPRARHRPGARLGGRRADARRGCGGARRAAGGRSALALALAGASVGAVVSLAPESGRDRVGLAAAQLVAGVPPAGAGGRIGEIEDTQTGYKILHTKDSQYHRIAVVEDDTSRYLRFDSSFQSGMYVDDPFRTRFEYSDYLQLPFAYRAGDEAGALRRARRRLGAEAHLARLPRLQVDVVELDPEVVDAAYKFFEVPRDPRLQVEVEDGRRFLARTTGPGT